MAVEKDGVEKCGLWRHVWLHNADIAKTGLIGPHSLVGDNYPTMEQQRSEFGVGIVSHSLQTTQNYVDHCEIRRDCHHHDLRSSSMIVTLVSTYVRHPNQL